MNEIITKIKIKCLICKKMRHHSEIEVLKYPIIDEGEIFGWNFYQFCNDNINCYIQAKNSFKE